ncbi:MAG TPA: tolB protein, partial [Polyangiaceae bacterium]
VTEEHIPKIAVLPSLSPDLEDVIVRGVVRRDFELTGLFDVIPDSKAPPGLYGFDDAVDVDAWRNLGAEAIVKVVARKHASGKVQVFGIAYFLNVGKEPVYEKKLLVSKDEVRVTAHRITDALLGALTGRPGGFASQFTFSTRWGRNRRVFTMDSDGHDLTPRTDPNHTAIGPAWGPNSVLFYSESVAYSPYRLMRLPPSGDAKPVSLPFRGSIYSTAFNKDYTKLAIAVAENAGSSIYVGNPDGSEMKKISKTELSTHPVWSPSGKLAWVGGSAIGGSQRVWLDGKAISPPGFTAAAPTFCDTEDGILITYAVQVPGDRQDLVLSRENGKGISRLTQNQGTNSYPACSLDGRMLAFFSTRGKQPGMYLMSLKRWRTQKLASQHGESLRWAPLPPPSPGAALP